MTIDVQGPDGTTVQFPDGTPSDVMTKAMAAKFGGPSPAPKTGFPGYDPALEVPRAGAPRMPAWSGVGRGLRDPIDAGAQLLTRGLEGVMPAGSSAEQFMTGQRQNVEQINREAEQQYQQQRGGTGLDTGRLVGNVLATAPVAAAAPAGIVGGALAGGASGALQPVTTPKEQPAGAYWMEKLKQTGVGAAAGGVGAAIGKGVSRLISPKSSPEVQTLLDAGVNPTPGQMMGGTAKRVEDAMTSVPLVGDAVKRAQTRAMEDFNRGAINKALEPIGEKLSGKTLLGRDAIDEAITKVSSAYDDLLPKLTAKADAQFATDMGNLTTLTRSLPADRAAQFDRIVTDKLLSRFNEKTATISGETMKQAESELGRLARQYASSGDADQRLLGDALKQVTANLRSLVERSNPAVAGELQAINSSYAQILRLQTAAARIGSEQGVFSPSQLLSAVRQMDPSLNKRAFARGDALMQPLAEAGRTVLGPRVPDSGTPLRAMTAYGLLSALGGGAGAATGVGPIAGAAAGAGLLGGYTPAGQRMTATLLGRRPEAAASLAQAIEQALPYVGSGAGAYATRR